MHLFLNSCLLSSFIILFISPAFPISANSFWEVDFNIIWSLSQIVSSVAVVVNCTFVQAGPSGSSISPVLPQYSQVNDAASYLWKSILQEGWLGSVLFTLTTIEGHLDLNGLAKHCWNNPDHISWSFVFCRRAIRHQSCWDIAHLACWINYSIIIEATIWVLHQLSLLFQKKCLCISAFSAG